MGIKVELRILELLASRICHDLISPIGAVGNGLELLEDAGPDMSGDALKLSANCVRKASALLEFFRMAYGTAGSDAGLRWDAAKQLADGLRVEARAPDGLVEAFSVEHAAGFNLCVQWHPEWKAATNPVSVRLLRAFGDACRAYRDRPRAPQPPR